MSTGKKICFVCSLELNVRVYASPLCFDFLCSLVYFLGWRDGSKFDKRENEEKVLLCVMDNEVR